jgi:hypothetical protein
MLIGQWRLLAHPLPALNKVRLTPKSEVETRPRARRRP